MDNPAIIRLMRGEVAHAELVLEPTESGQLLAMLGRVGIGHGIRHDHNPPGTAVMVESGESGSEFTVTE